MRQVQQCSSVETNPAQKDLDSVLYVGNISSGTGTEVKVNHGSSGCARGDLRAPHCQVGVSQGCGGPQATQHSAST